MENEIKDRIKRRKKSDKFTPEIPAESFDDIGGLDEIKEQILRQIFHLDHHNFYSVLGVKPPTGILLHGPPGCGKTLLAKAAAGQMAVKMIAVSTPGKIENRKKFT